MQWKNFMESFSSAQPNLFAGNDQPWFPKTQMPTIAAAMNAPRVIPVSPAAAVSSPWYKTRWVYIVILIVLVLLAIAYVSRNRFYPIGNKGPYTAAINSVANAERQADLREWAKLWQLSKQPRVKQVLAEVLNNELAPAMAAVQPSGSAAPVPQQNSTSPIISSENINSSAADPAFTVA